MPKLFHPEELELSNGIPVILQHYDGPVAATYWWVRTGSADEAPKEAGFAHFLEHMLFKDAAAKETGRSSTGQMATAIESLGGDINAYTSFDQTVYHVTCAAHHWERVLDAFGTLAKPQRFLKSDFEREREVILEELRKNEDSPGRQLFQSIFTTTFKKHPYGKPVIGFVKTLKAANVGALESFYKRNYTSSKMGLVLVGPFHDKSGDRKKQILRYLEKHFGQKVIKRRQSEGHPRPVEPALRPEPAMILRHFDVKTPTLAFAFRAPDLYHEDVPALDILAGVLGMGELSRMYQKLFYQTSLATDASASLYVPKDPGMLYIQAELDSMQKLKPAAEEILKELRRLADEGPLPEELARVIVNAESERLYSTQTADGMAGRLGFLKFVLGDLDFDQRYLEALRAVDVYRVREVAREYLDYRRMTIAALVPKSPEAEVAFDLTDVAEMAKRLLNPAEELASLGLDKPVRKTRITPDEELPIESFRLPSGIEVVYFGRPQSHVFSIQAAVKAGVRLEIAHPIEGIQKDWGAGNLMALSWTKGTEAHSAREIAAIVEGHAASMDGFDGRNSTGLQMTGLARDWSKLSELFSETLLTPTFPEEEVEHSRRVAEDSLRSIEDHTSQLCSKLFLETLFEKHPYGRLLYGSMESVKQIDSAKLKAFHRLWFRPERMVISISGAIKRKQLDLWLEDLEARARQSLRGQKEDLPQLLPDEDPLRAPRWVEKRLGREQTHILIGGLGTKVNADDRHGLRILHTLLGGQSGRLFIELREKRSLAYTVAPLSFEGIERGYVGTYIACAPEKREEALKGIQAVHEALLKKAPSKEEMNRAKEFFLGRRAMDMQSDSSLASHYGLEKLYGIPHLSDKALIRKVQGVTPKDVQRICREYLVEPYLVTSIVG